MKGRMTSLSSKIRKEKMSGKNELKKNLENLLE